MDGVYARIIKRILDLVLSLAALTVLLPLLLVLTLSGAVAMKGNPFFVQPRPGKDEKIFKLIKFRTMTDERDEYGVLLPDEKRLNAYGKFLRSSSLDELPELINIVKGDMSIVGPRPLATEYLPYYTEEEHHRHDVRAGLTGLAQISGRNGLSWESKFRYDLMYVNSISFGLDVYIVLKTVRRVLTRDSVDRDGKMPESLHILRAGAAAIPVSDRK